MRFANTEEIVVHHEDKFLRRAIPFIDDVFDAPPSNRCAVEFRYRAVFATDGAPARRLNGRDAVLPVERFHDLRHNTDWLVCLSRGWFWEIEAGGL